MPLSFPYSTQLDKLDADLIIAQHGLFQDRLQYVHTCKREGFAYSCLLTRIHSDGWQLINEASRPGVHDIKHGSLRHAWIGNVQLHSRASELQNHKALRSAEGLMASLHVHDIFTAS